MPKLEITPQRIAYFHEHLASGTLSVADVFGMSDGALTCALKNILLGLGDEGVIGWLLFKAQKASSRAKSYSPKFRRLSYDRKGDGMEDLCEALKRYEKIPYGWARDSVAVNFENVLYVELPTGQCSFHSQTRFAGPDYEKQWDGQRESPKRIVAFCEQILEKWRNSEKVSDPAKCEQSTN